MFIIRPIAENDFAALCELASVVKGLTTLPNDHKILQNKVYDSLKAFGPHVRKPGGEAYLFVLEDLDTKKIIGTSGIISKTGGFDPFYTYQIRSELYASKQLNIHRQIQTLHLITSHNGPSEIFGLFLNPEYRTHGLGKLLSLSRFMFMKQFMARFDETVISELRGVINADGKSPFWECVGKHFFDLDFYTADFLSGTGDKQFIEDLMPDHPIYIPMLPHEVQNVIGQVHHNTLPALKLLRDQGFVYKNEVDIFDAGPTVSTKLSNIKTIAESTVGKAVLIEKFARSESLTDALVSNTDLDFRCTRANVYQNTAGEIHLEKITADALQIQAGDPILYYPIAHSHPS